MPLATHSGPFGSFRRFLRTPSRRILARSLASYVRVKRAVRRLIYSAPGRLITRLWSLSMLNLVLRILIRRILRGGSSVLLVKRVFLVIVAVLPMVALFLLRPQPVFRLMLILMMPVLATPVGSLTQDVLMIVLLFVSSLRRLPLSLLVLPLLRLLSRAQSLAIPALYASRTCFVIPLGPFAALVMWSALVASLTSSVRLRRLNALCASNLAVSLMVLMVCTIPSSTVDQLSGPRALLMGRGGALCVEALFLIILSCVVESRVLLSL